MDKLVDIGIRTKMKNDHRILRIIFLWFSPILLIILYDIATYILRYYRVPHIPLPAAPTITSLTLFGILASPLWVLAGYALTYLFGSIGITYVIKLFSHSKLLRRKLVIQTKEELNNISSTRDHENMAEYLTPKSFSTSLGLVLGLNLAYTLLIIRYFQNFFALPQKISVYQYLLSWRFISVEFSLALLFLPLVTIVAPLLIGRIRIRQIDSSPLQNYWLSYVFSAAGGASAILLLLSIFQHKSTTAELIVASLFVYGIISWYTALGINLSVPLTTKNLASRLFKFGEKQNIFFGKIFVGSCPSDAEEV